jgi:RNA polymerase sigma factor (TIGR02999 family)
MTEAPGEVTVLLADMKAGREDALARLIPLLYAELRRLAGRYMRDERAGHTLQPTALVHEAFLRLAGQDRANWQNRAQFIGIAGQLMRRILVDHARKRRAAKRGAALVTLDEAIETQCAVVTRPEEILAVDEALTRLAQFDAQQARVVELRYFAGLAAEETAEALGVSLRTVERDWSMAKAWLRAELAGRGNA